MSIQIGSYTFEGPYASTSQLQERSGVHTILTPSANSWFVVDVGESSTVRSRVDAHERRGCWSRHSNGSLAVAALYTPNLQQPGRIAIEQRIRATYRPPCGTR